MVELDYSLYLVSDRNLLAGRDLLQEVRKAVKGGVTMVQLREKEVSSREFYQLAVSLKDELQDLKVPLIINDRVDIALAVDADGLHVGQEDLPFPVVRELLGQNRIIGLSVNNREQALEGARMGASYLGVGPVFPTNTKTDAVQPVGLDLLIDLKRKITIPIVAIGGINIDNLERVKTTGVDGAAVVSALMGVDNIKETAERFIKIWKKD